MEKSAIDWIAYILVVIGDELRQATWFNTSHIGADTATLNDVSRRAIAGPIADQNLSSASALRRAASPSIHPQRDGSTPSRIFSATVRCGQSERS